MEREQSLERDKVQLGLDWQRRCEGLERDHYHQSEGLVQGLASARAQVRSGSRRPCGVSEVLWALTSCPFVWKHVLTEQCDLTAEAVIRVSLPCPPALPRVSFAVSPTSIAAGRAAGWWAGRDGDVRVPPLPSAEGRPVTTCLRGASPWAALAAS